VLLGVAPLLAGLLSPVWGRLADRHGQKRMILPALAAYVVLLILSALVTSAWQLLGLRVGIGLFGAIGPLGLAMATSLGPPEQTGKAVGMVQSAQILAAAVGPFAGGLLADTIGIRLTFVVTAAFCAAAFVLVARYYQEAPRTTADRGGAQSLSLVGVARLPQVAWLLVVLFLVNFIGRSFLPILPLHLQELGVAPGRLAFSTGALISTYSVAAALSATTLGKASRSRSPRGLLLGTLVGGAGVVFPMALVPSFSAMIGLALLLGLASGGSLTLCYTIGGLMVPAEHRSTAYGFFSGAALFGGAVSPSFAGVLARWDLRGIYYLDAGLYALLALSVAPAALRGARPRPAPAAASTMDGEP
jgi:DHA1 family multidrug resistance protein-like MFS transporter